MTAAAQNMNRMNREDLSALLDHGVEGLVEIGFGRSDAEKVIELASKHFKRRIGLHA